MFNIGKKLEVIKKKKQDKLYKLFEIYNFAKNFFSTKHIYARISLFTKVFTKIDTHTHMYTHTQRVQTNYINTFFSSFKFQVKALETRVSKLNKLVVLLIVEHVSKLVNTVSLVYFKLCDETSNKLVRISDSRRNLVRWNFSFAKDSFPI